MAFHKQCHPASSLEPVPSHSSLMRDALTPAVAFADWTTSLQLQTSNFYAALLRCLRLQWTLAHETSVRTIRGRPTRYKAGPRTAAIHNCASAGDLVQNAGMVQSRLAAAAVEFGSYVPHPERANCFENRVDRIRSLDYQPQGYFR